MKRSRGVRAQLRLRKKRGKIYVPPNASDSDDESSDEEHKHNPRLPIKAKPATEVPASPHQLVQSSNTDEEADLNASYSNSSGHEGTSEQEDLSEREVVQDTQQLNNPPSAPSSTNSLPESEHELQEVEQQPVVQQDSPESDQLQQEEMSDSDESSENTSYDTNQSDEWMSDQQATSESDPEDQQDKFEDGDSPLYPGAPITLLESLMAILTLATKEHISGQLLEKILVLVALHCPLNNLCKKTLYQFKKFFSNLGRKVIVFHYFCSNCSFPVKSKETACTKCGRTDNSFFLEVPILSQLQIMFKRQGFYNDLQYRFNPNRKKFPENIEDIYDGQVYKTEFRNGFLNNPHNISLMLYTDGMQVFRSSSLSVWTVCLVINELEYRKRILPKNIILAGLWFGKGKPQPNLLLQPLKQSMDQFTNNGYKLKLHDQSEVVVKGKVLCFTCDLPAKCKFLGFKQYNGFYGCSHCLTPGERHPVSEGSRSSVQVYPFSQNLVPRTHAQTKEFAQQAVESRKNDPNASVNGVKALTWIFYLLPNIILCTAIDVMHGCFLGVCKLLLDLWFSSKYSRLPWTLYHLKDALEERLKSIRIPSYVHRFPRSLNDIALWKASEFKLFLMYYSIPLLQGIMDNEYLQHHCKLVSALFLLSQDSVSVNQISAARDMLISYLSDFSRLYHVRFMGINIHQLVHLPDVVINLGPVWVYSCFFLESLNGEFTKLVHGTRHVALQLCTSTSVFLHIPILIDKLPENSVAKTFCLSLLKKSKSVKIGNEVSEKIFAVGLYSNGPREIHLSKNLMREENIRDYPCVQIFHRLMKDGVMYFSAEYSRKSLRTESTYVSFSDENEVPYLGKVIRFIKCSNCTSNCIRDCAECQPHYFFIAKVYNRKFWFAQEIPGIRLSYLSNVEPSTIYKILPVAMLKCLCFYMKIGDREFIAQPINLKEVEWI